MKTPLELYNHLIENKEIERDESQYRCVSYLDNLFCEIINAHKIEESKRFNFFSFVKKEHSPVPKGLYMYGTVGRGKSMVMDMFFGALPENYPAQRVHFHEFMIEVHQFLHTVRQATKGTKKEMDQVLDQFVKERAKATKLICFDEFHVTDVADAMILGRLFEGLMRNGVVMIVTSNWAPDKLYEDGLQRDRFLPFIDFLKQNLEVMDMGQGSDYRLQCLSESGVYFTPLGEASSKKTERVFMELTKGAQIYSETLTIKGRDLEVPETAKGVARLNFAYLCERPMGAEDYLALAHHYHTIVLEGVPKITYDRRNEAKRFMTLIDALYDNRVKVIISADAEPDKLYRGEDHAFEFQRTVSRLTEMKSTKYLQKDDNS